MNDSHSKIKALGNFLAAYAAVNINGESQLALLHFLAAYAAVNCIFGFAGRC